MLSGETEANKGLEIHERMSPAAPVPRSEQMTTPAKVAVAAAPGLFRRTVGRLWSGLVAVWAAITGVAPHVLHHVGPLAGAAIVSGVLGTALFGAVGFVATIPFLLRLRRRFGSWLAPAIALAVFVAVFTVSTTVIGPRLTGSDTSGTAPVTDVEHEEHHE